MWRCLSISLLVLACGPRPRPAYDAGMEELDAGLDAGRPRGDNPPTGWQTAVAKTDGGVVGLSVSSAKDAFGQPLLASYHSDPNGDGQGSDGRIVFTRWNGTAKKFEELVRIETVGEVAVSGRPYRAVSVAYDAQRSRVGVAYSKSPGEVRYAFSNDDGVTFSLQTVAAGPATHPALAMRDDVAHVVFVADGKVQYRRRTGQSGAWAEEVAPALGTATDAVDVPPALALDASGAAGVAYFVHEPGASTARLAFWRPGTTTATEIATSDQIGVLMPLARLPGVALSFTDSSPRVAFHLKRVEATMPDDTPELYYAQASDAAGAMWGTPVAIPRNGYLAGGGSLTFHSTRWYQALVTSSNRQAIAAFYGSNGAIGQCGGPKVARSTDGQSFMTCSPMGTPFGFAGEWLSMWEHAPGRLTLIFNYDGAAMAGTLAAGIIMWREP